MIEHKEAFGLRVCLEDQGDVQKAKQRLNTGYWGQNRIDRIEQTHPAIAADVNMIDVHFKED